MAALAIEMATILAAALLAAWIFGATLSRAGLAGMFTTVLTGGVGATLAIGCFALFCRAFVIPTGSMATAVNGAHAEVVCENCNWEYDGNMSFVTQPYAMMPTDDAIAACPNCGHVRQIDVSTPYHDGDRIYVELNELPQRWEVGCFEPPGDEDHNLYIDRTVGLPGETVEIAAGDIFINGVRAAKAPNRASEMWVPVHDTAFQPQTPVAVGPQWTPDEESSSWRRLESGGFGFRGADRAVLEFMPAIVDELSYNVDWFGGDAFQGLGGPPPVVADVRTVVEMGEFEESGEGYLEWGREYGRRRVVVRVSRRRAIILVDEIGSDAAQDNSPIESPSSLTEAQGDFEAELAAGDRLEFALRDGAAYVLLNGNTAALATNALPTEVAEVESSDAKQPADSRLWFAAENCAVTMNRIQSDRDVYYLTIEEMDVGRYGGEAPNPITLAADEYFMLGDNSRHSQDSRFFGRVSQDKIQGVLRAIYWPPERMREFP